MGREANGRKKRQMRGKVLAVAIGEYQENLWGNPTRGGGGKIIQIRGQEKKGGGVIYW